MDILIVLFITAVISPFLLAIYIAGSNIIHLKDSTEEIKNELQQLKQTLTDDFKQLDSKTKYDNDDETNWTLAQRYQIFHDKQEMLMNILQLFKK